MPAVVAVQASAYPIRGIPSSGTSGAVALLLDQRTRPVGSRTLKMTRSDSGAVLLAGRVEKGRAVPPEDGSWYNVPRPSLAKIQRQSCDQAGHCRLAWDVITRRGSRSV